MSEIGYLPADFRLSNLLNHFNSVFSYNNPNYVVFLVISLGICYFGFRYTKLRKLRNALFFSNPS